MIQSPAGYQGDVRIKRYLDFYQAGYGVAMLSSGVAFSPLSLFAQGEQGGWYDPSDLTTLFQDAAGTTPVTAVEQPVGLVLDKSKGLTQTLLFSTDFASSTGWSLTNATISGGTLNLSASASCTYTGIAPTIGLLYRVTYSITAINPGSGGVRVYVGSTGAGVLRTTTGTFTEYIFASGATATYFFTGSSFVSATIDNLSVTLIPGNHLSQSTSTARPVLSARVNALVNTATLSTQNVTTLATNYTLRFEGTGSIALSGTGSGTYSAGVHTVTCTAGTLTLTVTGSVTNADLRPANAGVGLPAYQRVGAATSGSSTAAGNADYDTTGFPTYLRFDGVDDHLVSATISPGSVDKAQVFAGVRKLSDAAISCLYEMSAAAFSNAGTLNALVSFDGASAPGAYWGVSSRGAGSLRTATTTATYAAPLTAVHTHVADISGDNVSLRINGTQVAQSTADQGTGNYLSYPFYIGRRGGSTLPFNGQLYSLILRFSATNMDAATIASTETWVNSKTRAY